MWCRLIIVSAHASALTLKVQGVISWSLLRYLLDRSLIALFFYVFIFILLFIPLFSSCVYCVDCYSKHEFWDLKFLWHFVIRTRVVWNGSIFFFPASTDFSFTSFLNIYSFNLTSLSITFITIFPSLNFFLLFSLFNCHFSRLLYLLYLLLNLVIFSLFTFKNLSTSLHITHIFSVFKFYQKYDIKF